MDKCVSPTDYFDFIECPVEWPFGHGLSYTTFTYSTPLLSSTTITQKDSLTITVTVTNSGEIAGKDAMLLFVTDHDRGVTPEKKLLKRFTKTPLLQPGETYTFTTTLEPYEDLAYAGVADRANSRMMLDSGLFYISIGPYVDCRAEPEKCVSFTLQPTDDYNPICEAACATWARAGEDCDSERLSSLPTPLSTFIAQEPDQPPSSVLCHERCLQDGDWDWNYVSCLEAQVWSKTCKMDTYCRSTWPTGGDHEHGGGGNGSEGKPSGNNRKMMEVGTGPTTSSTVTSIDDVVSVPVQEQHSPWLLFLGGALFGGLGAIMGLVVITRDSSALQSHSSGGSVRTDRSAALRSV